MTCDSDISVGQHSCKALSLNWVRDPMCKWRGSLTFPGLRGSRNSKMGRESCVLSFCPIVLAGCYYVLFSLPLFCYILSPLIPLLFFHVVLTLSHASLWPSLSSDETCCLIAVWQKMTMLCNLRVLYFTEYGALLWLWRQIPDQPFSR